MEFIYKKYGLNGNVIDPASTARADDFINNSERDATPANDAGRVVKLETDARIHENFTLVERNRVEFPEETSSGITAGDPLFLQSDGELSKNATISGFSAAKSMRVPVLENNDSAENNNIIWLTGKKFAHVYTVFNGSQYDLICEIGTVGDDGSIGAGQHKKIANRSSGSSASAFRLSDTSFVVLQYAGTTLYTNVVSIADGGAITVGADNNINDVESYADGVRLSDTSFALTYRDGSDDDTFVIAGTVSGTTITYGSAVSFDTDISSQQRICALSATKIVAVWSDGTDVLARVGNISGTTVTAATNTYTVGTASANKPLDCVGLTSTTFAVTYLDSGNDVNSRVGSVDGSDVITFGTEVELDPSADASTQMQLIGFGSNALVIYDDGGSSPYTWKIIELEISGTAITEGINGQLEVEVQKTVSSNVQRKTIAVVNGYLVAPFKVSEDTITTLQTYSIDIDEVYIGVAQTAPDASGDVVGMITGKTGAIFSGLTFGKKYLFDQAGALSEVGLFGGGVAIDTDELLIK